MMIGNVCAYNFLFISFFLSDGDRFVLLKFFGYDIEAKQRSLQQIKNVSYLFIEFWLQLLQPVLTTK